MDNTNALITYVLVCFLEVVAPILLLSIALYLCATRIHLSTNPSQQQQRSTSAQTSTTDHDQQGLDEATIISFPKLLYSELKLQSGSSSTASCCSICLADYNETDTLLVLPDCGHLFHVKCVYPWLRLHGTCPICRKYSSTITTTPTQHHLNISITQITPLPSRQE